MHPRTLIPTALAAGLLAVAALPGHAQEALATPKDTSICTPVAVGNFVTRVHVRCSVAVSGILYFAVSTSNANNAARSLALLSVALASGRDVRIYYDPADTSGAAIGCQTNDCRLATYVEML